MSDLRRFPLNLNLINNVEVIMSFIQVSKCLTLEVIISFIQVSKCLTLTIHMSSPAVEMR